MTTIKKWTTLILCALTLTGIPIRANATTITVNTTGGPVSNKCNITDAVQAASTNAAVHGCAAGSKTATDTIQLASATYQGYSIPLHIPTSGGTLVIQGNGENKTVILAPNRGFPSPNPLSSSAVCPSPAAIFSGGSNVTIKNLTVQGNVTGLTGICQYAGTLNLNGVLVGDGLETHAFTQSGLRSWPNGSTSSGGTNIHRVLNLTDTSFSNNIAPSWDFGGAMALYGNVDVTVTVDSNGESNFDGNSADSGGGAINSSGYWGKMGSLTLYGVSLVENASTTTTFGVGGAIYLRGDDSTASVTLNYVSIDNNAVSGIGGAIFIGDSYGENMVQIYNSLFSDNTSYYSYQDETFNSDFEEAGVYNAVYCSASNFIGFGLFNGNGTPEWYHSPPLKGDSTCTFSN